MKFLQTKPQVKKMNIDCYDLYYTVIKKRKENVDEKNNYIKFIDDITRKHYIGIKPRETTLK